MKTEKHPNKKLAYEEPLKGNSKNKALSGWLTKNNLILCSLAAIVVLILSVPQFYNLVIPLFIPSDKTIAVQGDNTKKPISIIRDITNELMWGVIPDGKMLTWNEANKYAEDCTAEGFDDWRLPSEKEVKLVNMKDKQFKAHVNRNLARGFYWTSKIKIKEEEDRKITKITVFNPYNFDNKEDDSIDVVAERLWYIILVRDL